MRLPTLYGLIRRRLLVNFRVDPEILRQYLPHPFQPKLHHGHAIAGICLIRLEEIRPKWLPKFCGISSENAAHRIAVEWTTPEGECREGVFIARRDTGSALNHWTGGRLFPGEQSRADFAVTDDGHNIAMSIRARDGGMAVDLFAHETKALPASSCFGSIQESSQFFENGSIGYSVTRDCCRLDGMKLCPEEWSVRPLAVEKVESSFFSDRFIFQAGSVAFDHALLMRDIRHHWKSEPDMFTEPKR